MNAVIGQAGGPTAVINQSLVGVARALRDAGAKRVLGMRHGVRGLTGDRLVDLAAIDDARLERVAATPAAALGSTRDKPDADACRRILDACRRHGIDTFFYIGGNDSAGTCHTVSRFAREAGASLRCFHVPKTVDNDLMENDHTPGFPSAARFVATAFLADSLDNASLPGVKINVVMGRHAGFLPAAAALARRREGDGPHLIYLPEVPFDTDRFVEDVREMLERYGRCQVAVSEGIADASGTPIGATLISDAERDAHGNVQLSGSGALGDGLRELLKVRLAGTAGKSLRVRADTFGYIQRCWPDPSPVDAREAREAGRFAASLALKGAADGSVALVRAGRGIEFRRVELAAVADKTRHVPPEFIAGHRDVSRAFLDYCRPLVGELPGVEQI